MIGRDCRVCCVLAGVYIINDSYVKLQCNVYKLRTYLSLPHESSLYQQLFIQKGMFDVVFYTLLDGANLLKETICVQDMVTAKVLSIDYFSYVLRWKNSNCNLKQSGLGLAIKTHDLTGILFFIICVCLRDC